VININAAYFEFMIGTILESRGTWAVSFHSEYDTEDVNKILDYEMPLFASLEIYEEHLSLVGVLTDSEVMWDEVELYSAEEGR
jgi:hypothetical protein